MTLDEARSVDTVETIQVHGKAVLLAVNYNHDLERICAAIDHLASEMEKQPDRSIRVVLDVTGGSVHYKATAYWETQLPLYERKVLKAAVVTAGMKRLVTSAIVTTARLAGMSFVERVAIFEDRQKAIAWVAAD